MLSPTHLAVGYLFSKTYCGILGMPCGSAQIFTTVSIASSLFPDIDIFFGKKVNEHRNTVLYAPIFWTSIMLLLIPYSLFNRNSLPYIVAIGFGIFSHIFLDWLSGRTTGIRLFYPFSKRMYSLFPLNPAMGNVDILPNKKNKEKYFRWLRNFFSNPFLAIVEIFIFINFLLALFFCKT